MSAPMSHDRENWLRVAKERDEIKAERDQLRAENTLLRAAQKISEDTDEQIIKEVLALRAEVERLKKQIKDDNRSYGCELRDPYGTIWEQATKDRARAESAEAEAERLREWQAGVIENARAHHAQLKDAIARAERAEASLHALRLVCGTTDADKFTTWVDRANARAEKAEAELATERARMKKIETALKDAISTYFGDDKLVTAERIEAWQAALKEDVK